MRSQVPISKCAVLGLPENSVYLGQQFSTGTVLPPPTGHLAMSEDILGCHHCGGKPLHQVGKARKASTSYSAWGSRHNRERATLHVTRTEVRNTGPGLRQLSSGRGCGVCG